MKLFSSNDLLQKNNALSEDFITDEISVNKSDIFVNNVSEESTEADDFKRCILIGRDLERARIARDLHDALGQELNAIRLFICAIERIENDSDKTEELVKSVKQLVDKSILTIKEISVDLMPSSLKSHGLRKTIIQLINRQNILNPDLIRYDIDSTESTMLSEAETVFVYRIIQEFITNSIKYAQADCVNIVVRNDADAFEVNLNDDGVGFAIERDTDAGGLNNIRSRLKALNAKYLFESNPETGTKLNFVIYEK